MAKQKAIEQDGEVIKALPNAQFRVRLDSMRTDEIFGRAVEHRRGDTGTNMTPDFG